jgi:eukaryotic-like serine/threonine-protein kinase
MAEVARRLPICRRNAEDRGDLYFATNLCVGETNLWWLANDDPDGARAVVQEMMRFWSKRGFHAQHWFELQALSLIDLYEGAPDKAVQRIDETWPALARSMILRVQVGLGMALFMRGSATARVGQTKRALRDIRSLRKIRHHWTDALADLIEAGIHRDASMLRRAVERFDAVNMASFAAAARRRLGEWTDDPALIAEADAYFAREQIVSAERWTRMLVAP